MSKLTRDDVLKLAALSRLSLSEEEVARLQSELSSILGYVEILSKVNTQGVEPTSQVTGLTNVMRNDSEIQYRASAKQLLANAPELEDSYFKVKRVLG